jgi:uncharacterized protein (TIGR02268 family)
VQLEGRDLWIQLVDTGARSLLLEAAMELPPSERWLLRVRFLDGALPAHAVFALTAHPTQVDGEVRVSRRALSPEACQTELSQLRSRCTQAPSPADFALAGWIGAGGVGALSIPTDREEQSARELVMNRGSIYSTPDWAVVLVEVENQGRQPWVPAQAKLTDPRQGTVARIRTVRMKEPALAPGAAALIAVEADRPLAAPGAAFSLELSDEAGQRTLVITNVTLPNAGSGPLKETP